jgi:autotransporter translocation and assembly factor TamB
VGLLLLGLVIGFAITLATLYLFVRRTQRMTVVEERVRIALGLPEDAFRLERIEADGSLRVSLRRVAFLNARGDTIVSAPTARGTLDATSLNGTGPIVIRDSEIVRPDLRLSQDASGTWNVFGIVAAEADGTPVRAGGAAGSDEEASRPLVFRGITIVDGRARIAYPVDAPPPPPAGRFASLKRPRYLREGGRWVRLSWLSDLDARLSYVRVGGLTGWRVDVAGASAAVRNPDTRIAALRATFEDRGDQVIRFTLNELRTPRSAMSGSGTMTPVGEELAYDVDMRFDPLDLRDLQGMGLAIPNAGTATFALGMNTLSGGRTQWSVTDARVAILDSRASGDVTIVTALNQSPAVTSAALSLERIELDDLEQLGYLDRTGFAGTLSGTVTSPRGIADGRGALRLDLAARLTPRDDPSAEPSVITAVGGVRLTGGEEAIRLDGVRVQASPLYLATLRSMAPEQAEMLRGTLRGGATLSGTLKALRISDGDLAYAVGDAPESRILGLAGTVSAGPPFRYSLRARAEPIALATLTELVPSLPFRSATLSGPIAVSGTTENVDFNFDLSGAAGSLAARGAVSLAGEVPRFDVSGSVEAFRASALMASAPAAARNPLTGTFTARGTTEDLGFSVNLTQGANGHFALAGTVRRPGGSPPQFDVSGRVDDFRIGALLGRPDMLPDPVSGPVRLAGGGRQPYRFDVELRGGVGAVDVEGWYAPGTVPSYAVSGAVANLDLSGLPGLAAAPPTRLTGTLALQGRGTTPETFEGRLDFRATPGSTVGRLALEQGLIRLEGRDGILRVDTLAFGLRGARVFASGAIGLTSPTNDSLRFALDIPELAALRSVVPGGDTLPDLAGALTASGTLTGSVRNPTIAARGGGRGLRFGTYAAGTLAFDVAGRRAGDGWTGRANLDGSALEYGAQKIASIHLETSVTPAAATFAFSGRRDAETELTAAGTLELNGLAVNGAIFDSLALRLGNTRWRLMERARLGWGDRGLAVENLALRRSDGGAGFIEADGLLPPTGTADLRIRAGQIQLADVRRLMPTLPEMSGTLSLQASVLGPVTDPRLVLDAAVDSLTTRGVTIDRLAVLGRYQGGRMEVSGDAQYAGREVLELRAGIPMTVSLGGIVPKVALVRDGALTATLTADSVPLALAAAAVATIKDAEGVARARIDVAGTLREPQVRGTATVSGGALTVVPLGVRWEAINGLVSMNGDQVRLDSLVATTEGKGTARITGTVLLDDTERPDVAATVFLNNFQVIRNRDVADLEANASLRIAGRFPNAVVTGNITVEDGTIYLPEFGAAQEGDILEAEVGEIGADTVTAPAGGAALLAAIRPSELRVALGDAVWLQSPDARIQISGEVMVDQPPGSETFSVFGDLNAERGSYTLAIGPIEREFEIVSGLVRFYGTPELNPGLDIVAEYEVRDPDLGGDDLTVQVHLTGTVQNPQVALTANTRQPLPPSEIASLLVFGRQSATAGTAFQALSSQIVGGVFVEEIFASLFTRELEQQLIRTGLVDYVRIRARPTGTGLQAFNLSSENNIFSSVSLELGKELIDNVFLTFEVANLLSSQGGQQAGASLDWEITRSWSLRLAAEPVRRDPILRQNLRDGSYQGSFDVRRRWEYGRPKARDPLIPRPRREPAPGQPSTPAGEPPPPPPPETRSTTTTTAPP